MHICSGRKLLYYSFWNMQTCSILLYIYIIYIMTVVATVRKLFEAVLKSSKSDAIFQQSEESQM